MAKGKIVITGYDELIKEIEKSGVQIEEALIEAVELSGKNATNRFAKMIDEHTLTGLTKESLVEEPKAKVSGGMIILNTGFDISKGGSPAIWLDRGTPKQKPLNYVKKVKNDQAVKGAIGYVLGQVWRNNS